MREILIKGKRVDNGEWVEGYYVKFGNAHYILTGEIEVETHLNSYGLPCTSPKTHEVIPETVGQFTGLTVPNGKIFEHDIVTAKFKSNGARYNFTVKYSNEKGCFVFGNGCVKVPFDNIRSVRIIGDIHDNPELLKGGE